MSRIDRGALRKRGLTRALAKRPRPGGSSIREGRPVLASTAEVLAQLERLGLLLKQDKLLPNVVTILTGESLSTSWWSHPKGREIFRTLSELADHPDVLSTKLLSGKDTLVHRKLWPAFLAVAIAGEPWQSRGLSEGARRLLSRVDRSTVPVRSAGSAVKELVSQLLVHATEVHTESGRHEMAIEPWSSWAQHTGVAPTKAVAQARGILERAGRAIGACPSALPWRSAART